MARQLSAVARARALLGVRFRWQGRDGDGLDCLGLAALALGLRGVPGGYRLRGGDPAVAAAWLDARLVRVAAWAAGDLLLVRSGPGQLHCAIWTGDGMIHADAGLGRVVERPGMPPWPVIGAWRQA
ncbi:NlpC/P60 family protein [Sphingomonas sp. CFBP 8760]|uniref:NlpC/P60 family protein n=1 Tax=Sphingomonas sp. CFBP 8760 TaxID=2775282 RepID=UPI003145336D